MGAPNDRRLLEDPCPWASWSTVVLEAVSPSGRAHLHRCTSTENDARSGSIGGQV
jgi:hypothetical protein